MVKINFKNLGMDFGKTQVLSGINLTIEPGEFVTFVGPSGCGKTTLLRIVAGLLKQTRGELYFNEQEVTRIPPLKRGIAMVFQSYALYPHLNVYNNMTLGLKQSKLDKKVIEERISSTSKMLHIENLLKRYPSELSGGQRQRVAIGRAIARKPEVLLFDEPLSNLDAALRLSVRMEITKLHQALKSTTIYVTHDQVEAMTLSNKIVVINRGRIEQVGSPLELYLAPANLFVASFLGSPKMNFIEAEFSATKKTVLLPDSGRGNNLPWKHKVTGTLNRCVFGFRSEHATVKKLSGKEKTKVGQITATIEGVENMGEEMILAVRPSFPIEKIRSGEFLMLKAKGFSGFKMGDSVAVSFTGKGYLFDAQTGAMVSSGEPLSPTHK